MKHNGGGVADDPGRNGNGAHRRPESRTDLELERVLVARHGRLRRRHRKRRSILLVLVLLLASIIALVLATVAFTGSQILLSTCTLKDLRPLSLGENSFLYTNRMRLLGVVPSATNRQPLPLRKMSPWLPRPPSRSRTPGSGSTAPSTIRASLAPSTPTFRRGTS